MTSTSSVKMDEETIGQMLGGLVFLKTAMRESLIEFYTGKIGMSLWLEQPNMILGFHQIVDDAPPDLQGMCTFVYPSRDRVDAMYDTLKDIADGLPRDNERYKIYQFFATDPEGRQLEFQAFLHPLNLVGSGVLSHVQQ